ncbi:MAG: LON peptidase substrate-binding domain-containing protein [Candidatus Rokuibacteriota bacterium]
MSAAALDPVVLPMFPLPEVTFFPHTLLPLHIFEGRYRAMVTDVLARDGRLCIVQLLPGYEATYAHKPAVRAVAGSGEIVKWERLPTGRYNIVMKGEARVRIEREHPSDTLYRVAVGRRLEDVAPREDVSPLVVRIQGACRRLLILLGRSADLLDPVLAEEQSPGALADRVAAAVMPDAAMRQRLLETLDVGERLVLLASALEDLVKGMGKGRGRG